MDAEIYKLCYCIHSPGEGGAFKGRLGKGVLPRPLKPEMFISLHSIKFRIQNKAIFEIAITEISLFGKKVAFEQTLSQCFILDLIVPQGKPRNR